MPPIKQRGASKREVHGFGVRSHEVSVEDLALFVIAVRLVDEVDPLHRQAVIEVDGCGVLVELLDVDYGDYRRPLVAHHVRAIAGALESVAELLAACDDVDDSSAAPEFVGCLIGQVEPIHDEEETRNLVAPLVPIS